MRISYGELEKAMAEAIAATDTAFGRPEAARDAVVWTECVLGHGYDLLRLASRLRPSDGWSEPVVAESDGAAMIESMSCPAYGLAARIADLAGAGATDEGYRTVAAYGAFGGWVAPYIAFRLAGVSHHAAVLWRPGAVEESEAPATLVLAAAAIQKTIPPILIAPGAAYGARERDKLLVGEIPARLITLLHAAADRRRDASLLAVVAVSAGYDDKLTEFISIGDAILSFNLASRAPELIDAGEKLRQVSLSGLEVDSGFAAALSPNS